MRNGITSNGDTKVRSPSVSIENGIPCVDKEMELTQEAEKKFVDDCVCKLCYDGDCFLTSYLNSPMRRLWHTSRYQATRFIENKYFEGFILFLIAFSSMTLVSYLWWLSLKLYLVAIKNSQNRQWSSQKFWNRNFNRFQNGPIRPAFTLKMKVFTHL